MCDNTGTIMLDYNSSEDTIAALATPPGEGGIAIVRISGKRSTFILKQIFSSKSDPLLAPRTLIYGKLFSATQATDTVLACYMPAPRSYTGEDMVEIHCHGGTASSENALFTVLKAGAKPAGPGEFTRRAFLNGKMDLAQAESVLEIISAESQAYLKLAERMHEGCFTSKVSSLIDKLNNIQTLIEASIEFEEEEGEDISFPEAREIVEEILLEIRSMEASYASASQLRKGFATVLAGRVNSGKSTLFNALLGYKRAIISPHPGTTRDWMEEAIEIDGMDFRIYDTAGLRQTEDAIENEGIRETERLLEKADIIIYLSEDPENYTLKNTGNPIIRVMSKADMHSEKAIPKGVIPVSSLTGQGISVLLEALLKQAASMIGRFSPDSAVLVERHKKELSLAAECIYRASGCFDMPAEENISFEINEARAHLERILGRVYDHDLLDSIFSKFCIGK